MHESSGGFHYEMNLFCRSGPCVPTAGWFYSSFRDLNQPLGDSQRLTRPSGTGSAAGDSPRLSDRGLIEVTARYCVAADGVRCISLGFDVETAGYRVAADGVRCIRLGSDVEPKAIAYRRIKSTNRVESRHHCAKASASATRIQESSCPWLVSVAHARSQHYCLTNVYGG